MVDLIVEIGCRRVQRQGKKKQAGNKAQEAVAYDNAQTPRGRAA
jgi:hypothetical protein